MKKIFLIAYVRKNLGDDLFIKMITNKYKDCMFFMNVDTKNEKYIDYLNTIPNLKISVVADTKEALYNLDVTSFDAFVYIGGSIFIEPQNKPLYFNDFDVFLINAKHIMYLSITSAATLVHITLKNIQIIQEIYLKIVQIFVLEINIHIIYLTILAL